MEGKARRGEAAAASRKEAYIEKGSEDPEHFVAFKIICNRIQTKIEFDEYTAPPVHQNRPN